ncbi:MAG TPA: Tad domain-containing protein [Pirellulaceae bacterium]|nr:Tad domain-containing protein [Pirellulaceae bacterium]
MRNRRSRRRGTVAVLATVMLVMVLAMAAFAIDIGYLLLAKSELQRSADAAALAAVWELVDQNELTNASSISVLEANVRSTASQFGSLNAVLRQNPAVPHADIIVGHLTDFTDPTLAIDTSGVNFPNVVQVKVSRTASTNGTVPFFLADVLGIDAAAAEATSTAAILTSFNGFRAPSDGGNLGILPFALDNESWNAMLSGNGTDVWKWNATTSQVEAGSDGILELNLYPQGTGSPGNRGTVDIGSNNNSTADIARQILDGVTPADLAYHGGSLEFDSNGEISLNGDTGISAGIKDELLSIKGEPRIIPVYTQLTGNGNNAQYTIVKFVGIRICDVKLTGSMSSKRVIVQPAQMVAEGGIPSTGTTTSSYVYSPTWIIR